MVSWKRVRLVFLAGVGLWFVTLVIAAALIGQLVAVDALGECGYFPPDEGEAHHHDPPSDFCDVGLIAVAVESIPVLLAAAPLGLVFSLWLPTILIFVILDVVRPWLRRRWDERSV